MTELTSILKMDGLTVLLFAYVRINKDQFSSHTYSNIIFLYISIRNQLKLMKLIDATFFSLRNKDIRNVNKETLAYHF